MLFYVTAVEQEKGDLILFARKKSNPEKRMKIRFRNFKPYLFLLENEETLNINREIEGGWKRLLTGEPVIKVKCRNISDYHILFNKYRKYALEKKDPKEQFFVELGLTGYLKVEKGKYSIEPFDFAVKPRILFLDVEVVADGIDEAKKGLGKIILLSLFDSYEPDRVYTLSVKPSQLKEIETKHGKYQVILKVLSEEGILEEFVKFVAERDFDLIVGFNVSFDLSVLFNRAKRLKVKLNSLSPFGNVKLDEKGELHIRGRRVLDFQKSYLYLISRKLPETSLAYIVKEELGEEYEVSGSDIKRLYRTDFDEAVKKNIKDVIHLYELDRKLELFKFFDSLRLNFSCDWEHIYKRSEMLDFFILRKLHSLKLVGENPPENREEEQYEGAIVFEPTVGIHENVVVYDIASTYPSVIITHNVSPETITNERMETIDAYKFKQDNTGFLPQLLKELLEEKKRLKELKKKTGDKVIEAKYNVVKYTVNAIYGLTGHSNFRFFDVRIASSITAFAREVLLVLKAIVESLGMKVIYGDTDSLFVSNVEDPQRVLEDLNDYIREYFKVVYGVGSYIEIELDKIFTRLVLIRKKGYAGLTSEGQIKIVGLDCVRSDRALFARELQRAVLEMILLDRIDELPKFLRLKRNEFWDIVSNRSRWWEIAIPTQINKHVDEYCKHDIRRKGIITSYILLGKKFRAGDKPLRIVIKKMRLNSLKSNVVFFERGDILPKKIEIDGKSMFQKVFVAPIDDILKLVGMDVSSIGTIPLYMFLPR